MEGEVADNINQVEECSEWKWLVCLVPPLPEKSDLVLLNCIYTSAWWWWWWDFCTTATRLNTVMLLCCWYKNLSFVCHEQINNRWGHDVKIDSLWHCDFCLHYDRLDAFSTKCYHCVNSAHCMLTYCSSRNPQKISETSIKHPFKADSKNRQTTEEVHVQLCMIKSLTCLYQG